jgi:hypothetical protein
MWSATAAISDAVSGPAENGLASGSVGRVRGTDTHGLAVIAPSITATSRIRRNVVKAWVTVDRLNVTSSASASVVPFGRAWAGRGRGSISCARQRRTSAAVIDATALLPNGSAT